METESKNKLPPLL